MPVGLSSHLYCSATKRRRLNRNSMPRLALRTSAATGRLPPLPDKIPLTDLDAFSMKLALQAARSPDQASLHKPHRKTGLPIRPTLSPTGGLPARYC